jgi:hypothetical protein
LGSTLPIALGAGVFTNVGRMNSLDAQMSPPVGLPTAWSSMEFASHNVLKTGTNGVPRSTAQ